MESSDSTSDDLSSVVTNEIPTRSVFKKQAKKEADESEDISNDEKTTKPTLNQTLEYKENAISPRQDSTRSLSKLSHNSKKLSHRASLSIGKGAKDK
jgi:hypothetical protein